MLTQRGGRKAGCNHPKWFQDAANPVTQWHLLPRSLVEENRRNLSLTPFARLADAWIDFHCGGRFYELKVPMVPRGQKQVRIT